MKLQNLWHKLLTIHQNGGIADLHLNASLEYRLGIIQCRASHATSIGQL